MDAKNYLDERIEISNIEMPRRFFYNKWKNVKRVRQFIKFMFATLGRIEKIAYSRE